jgi:hypothetical protein
VHLHPRESPDKRGKASISLSQAGRRSQGRRSRSAAGAGNRSFQPFAPRYLIATLWPLDIAGFARTLVKCDLGGSIRYRWLLRARCERTCCRRATEQRDKVAPLHCLKPPVLSTERIAQLGTAGDCCAAAFQTSLCRRWVNSTHYRSATLLSAVPQILLQNSKIARR